MNKSKTIAIVLIFLLCAVPKESFAEENSDQTFTISGTIYDSTGNHIANRTSIKVDSFNSVWSDDQGYYEFPGVSFGEHTIRAYFMNDGHVVSYRIIDVSSDINLDWYVGNNWFTLDMKNSEGEFITNSEYNSFELVGTQESVSVDDGKAVLGPLEIGQYYTIKANFGSIDNSSQELFVPLQSGSSTYPYVNDYSFQHGLTNKFGFITDLNGIGMPDVVVSSGSKSTITNDEGYFVLTGFEVGTSYDFNFTRSGINIIDPIMLNISDESSWMNLTSDITVELPEVPYFTTQVQTISESELLLEWVGGNFTDYYSVYQNGDLLYRGAQTEFLFQTELSGSYEFNIEATNQNGSTLNNYSLLIIVLPQSSQSDSWTSGMSWNYETVYTPLTESRVHNISMTVVGTESVTDSFGRTKESFLTRINSNTSEPGTQSYRWIDTQNFFTLHTYWVDAPSISSYYMEGTLGWYFTNSSGIEVNPLESEETLSMHFNRTNVIGVPGHPDGTDDTQNIVEVNHNVSLTTKAGTFSTTHIVISDKNDGIVSWEMWYNDTVKNWVKIIDRLPGTHSEMVVKELSSYYFPIVPQFITESKTINNDDFSIQWADFDGSVSYQLMENNNLIYSGNDTSFNLEQRLDGIYSYQINAEMVSGEIVEGNFIRLEVFYILPPPSFITESQTIISTDEIAISWENSTESISWYSLILIDSEGEVSELYNGTETSFLVEGLEDGQNRFRVKQGMENGKFSQPSDSIFINVENSMNDGEESEKTPDLPLIIVIFTILFSAYVFKKGDFDD